MNITLSGIDFAALSPLIILLVGALTVLLIESISTEISKKYSFLITLATLVIALVSTLYAPASHNPLLTPWLRFDQLGVFFSILFIAVGIASVLLTKAFLDKFQISQGEYYFLLLSAIFGLILIGQAQDFLSIFIGLETLSISLYVLCGYMKHWDISNEGSLKYFLMGALASAFLLYGIALVYGAVGSTNLTQLLANYQKITGNQNTMLFLGGIALITLGFAFKAAIVPFHLWAPDVYQGASTPVTSFMAVGTKIGAFAALSIIFLVSLPDLEGKWRNALALLAYPTLIYANFVAMRQTQLRRFFAYSGISHAGYLLIPVAVGGPEALASLLFYLVVYAFATFGCFVILTYFDESEEGMEMSDLKGLFQRSPWLAGLLTLCLLTLAGIPPTAGFFAKFYIFKIAFQAGYYGLVVVGLLAAILSAYYYLRMIGLMFSENSETTEKAPSYWTVRLVGIFCLSGILLLSIYPGPLLQLLSSIR